LPLPIDSSTLERSRFREKQTGTIHETIFYILLDHIILTLRMTRWWIFS